MGTLENITDTMFVLETLARKQGLKKRGQFACHCCGNSSPERNRPLPSAGLVESTDGNIHFSDVDIVSPTGTCCCRQALFPALPAPFICAIAHLCILSAILERTCMIVCQRAHFHCEKGISSYCDG